MKFIYFIGIEFEGLFLSVDTVKDSLTVISGNIKVRK
jgi:hypothetical protein